MSLLVVFVFLIIIVALFFTLLPMLCLILKKVVCFRHSNCIFALYIAVHLLLFSQVCQPYRHVCGACHCWAFDCLGLSLLFFAFPPCLQSLLWRSWCLWNFPLRHYPESSRPRLIDIRRNFFPSFLPLRGMPPLLPPNTFHPSCVPSGPRLSLRLFLGYRLWYVRSFIHWSPS